MPPKKILFCESNADGTVGGSFFSLLFLINGLDKSRYEPRVIFYRDHALVPRYRESGIPTYIFEKPKPFQFSRYSSSVPVIGRLLGAFMSIPQRILNVMRFLLIPAMRNAVYLKRNKIDLVHLNNSVIRNNEWMIAALLTGTRCITHERGINNHFPFLARMLAKRINAVICISQAVKDNMVARGISPDNLIVIHNGLDPDQIKAKRPSSEILQMFNIPDNAPVIGIVGNIKEWKGQETVVRSVAILNNSYPNIRCFLVGDTAPADRYYEDRLRTLIDELGIKDNIIFTGYQTDVADFLNAMDIVIHASILPEPFGRVLIDAMAMRKPLVGAGDGAVPEIISENNTGLMFKPGDHEDLARAVGVLLADPALAAEMGIRGFDRLTKEFHINANIASTQKLYESFFSD